jgi:hypothetical protein
MISRENIKVVQKVKKIQNILRKNEDEGTIEDKYPN